MAVNTETAHAGEFILSEANGRRSREKVTIETPENLAAGMVVGLETASGKYHAYDNGAADGTEVAAGVLFDAVDASAADAEGVIVARDAEVKASDLNWNGQGATPITDGTADLAALGIILR